MPLILSILTVPVLDIENTRHEAAVLHQHISVLISRFTS